MSDIRGFHRDIIKKNANAIWAAIDPHHLIVSVKRDEAVSVYKTLAQIARDNAESDEDKKLWDTRADLAASLIDDCIKRNR